MKDLNIVYLVQGAWVRLSQLRFPENARIFALCYDHEGSLPGVEETIFDSKCSWAAGRNRLQTLALGRYPAADYFIFCDDDILFTEGSFLQFEAMLAETHPVLGVPVMPKAVVCNTVSTTLRIQRCLRLDEQMVALHRSVMGEYGIAPLETAHDEVSWFAACLIFEYSILKKYNSMCHQYNNIRIENPNHTKHDGTTLYKIGDRKEYFPLVIRWIAERFGSYDKAILDPYQDTRRIGEWDALWAEIT